jgi:hypothetical protein
LAEKSIVERILYPNSENNFAPIIGERFQHYRQLLDEFVGAEAKLSISSVGVGGHFFAD